ncbi:hypothetical protein AXG93_3061s1050 [Marchantia polymorpha subsp. ruderalis]|uniref:Uncharacterized protein n=1 Tax=Marchantia polymorpha subsp. ruderalis TaxID=1480154 RepID=A0A176WMU9_MARPO|nr:hypothetical protein AXG93_3061s1050 [Marchantia polymorpha subsp. ruderalis]
MDHEIKVNQEIKEELKDLRLQPSAWNAAWEQAQGAVVPSKEIKRAANILVRWEHVQQSMGWLLLTHIGVMLGSFGQLMSRDVCGLSWGIFTLEAILKYGRSWAHSLYFRGVPCAIVALHNNNRDTASASLVVFFISVLIATLVETVLYGFYIKYTLKFWYANSDCYNEGADCTDGKTNLMDMLIISMIIVCLHWASSLRTVLAAMGMGISARVRDSSSWFRRFSKFLRKREEKDRLMCLTWWVHMARHGHLTAVVASAQDSDCGLPGHWFKSKEELFKIVEECDKGDHPSVLPLNFLIETVEPLKRLAGSEAVEHVEVALGALLNASISGDECTSPNSPTVIELILDSNILDSNEVGRSFMSCLIRHAHIRKSTLCQELAVRLLSHLVEKEKRAREALMSYKDEQGGVPDLQLCTALIKHGVSSPIKAGGAAVLAEIAYSDDREVKGSDPHIEECIQALVTALKSTTAKLIIVLAAKALCRLAYNNQDVKAAIVKAGGIPPLVDLLKDALPDSDLHDINGQTLEFASEHIMDNMIVNVSPELPFPPYRSLSHRLAPSMSALNSSKLLIAAATSSVSFVPALSVLFIESSSLEAVAKVASKFAKPSVYAINRVQLVSNEFALGRACVWQTVAIADELETLAALLIKTALTAFPHFVTESNLQVIIE